MRQLTANKARANIDRLLDEAATSHEPILITGKSNNAVFCFPRRLGIDTGDTVSFVHSGNEGVLQKWNALNTG